MCSQTRCSSCGKPTWAGCGAHIEQALANVPRDQRCSCRERKANPPPATQSQGKRDGR